MKTSLSFEEAETKKLLSKLDFEFFLKQNIKEENYAQKDVESIYLSYDAAFADLKMQRRLNKKQFNYYLEGQVRKGFRGGFLPALFHLDDSKKHVFLDFPAIGENWAYFTCWQTYHRRKVTYEKIWNKVIKIGSVLGILLSIIKLIELIFILPHSTAK